MKKLICILSACCMLAGGLVADTVWNPAGNGIVPPAVGDWATGANWTNGDPTSDGGKAVFNVPGAAEAQVSTSIIFNQLVQGDNGSGGIIRILNGGSLSTTSTWSSVGYNSTAQLIVEDGGAMIWAGHMWIGASTATAQGTIDISGTLTQTGGILGLGTIDAANPSGGTGTINVLDGGLLVLNNISATSIFTGSSLNVSGSGKIQVAGDKQAVLNGFSTAGLITGNGTGGNVFINYDGVNTTVRAVPEPATIGLIGVGLLVSIVVRRLS